MLRRGVWASCLEFEFESRDQIRDDSYGNWSGASCTCSREISRSGQLRNPDRVPGFPLVIGKRLLPARGPSTSVIPGKAEADGLTGERLRDHLVKETNAVLKCSDKRSEIVGIAIVEPTKKPFPDPLFLERIGPSSIVNRPGSKQKIEITCA